MTELYMAGAGGLALRFNAQRPELRESSGGVKHIAGYASVFGRKSRNLGGFVEQIDRRAFDQSELQGWPDVICRYNHDDNYLLGTTRGNTLTLRTDDTGLWYDCLPPSFRADIVELCARGDVTQSSFAFRVPDNGDYWERSGPGGMPLRTVTNTELVDVAPVNTPAYAEATASARAFDDDLIHSLARLKECSPAEVRNYLNEAGNVAKFFKRTDGGSAGAVSVNQARDQEGLPPMSTEEDRAVIKKRGELPDSVFAYIEPGHDGEKVDGRTPDKYRHFPLIDESHIRNALSQAPKSPFGDKAMPKIKAAAKAHGITVNEQNSLILEAVEEVRVMFADMFDADEELRGDLPPWLQKAKDKKDGKDDDSEDDEDDDSKDKKSDAKKDMPEKKSADEEAEDRAADAPTDDMADDSEDDEDEDDSKDDAARAIEAEHQEMRDRLLRHRLDDVDLYAGLED